MTPKAMTPDGDNLAQILRAIEKHLDSLVRFQYAQMKKEAFSNEIEEKVYELTGTKPRDEICRELHISPNKLAELWNKWSDLGLLVKQGGGYKKTVE